VAAWTFDLAAKAGNPDGGRGVRIGQKVVTRQVGTATLQDVPETPAEHEVLELAGAAK
jgi:hypothetical protein